MEWTDIFSGPAFEPVKSRELHLGKDCDLSRPLVVRDLSLIHI
mgnify:CR=1 FL=1